MKLERLRVCSLKMGDEFIMYGLKYKVLKIENGRIFFGYNEDHSLGQNSMQIILLIIKQNKNGNNNEKENQNAT